MPPKRQLQHLKSARAASSKKRKSEASSLLNSAQPQIDNNKLVTRDTRDTSDTSDTEVQSRTWFWNQSANETELDSKEEDESDVDEEDCKEEQPRTKQAVGPKVSKVEIRWNKEGEQSLRGGYGKGSKRTQMRHNKSVWDLEKEASKTYNFQALSQQGRDLGMISQVSNQVGLE